jgi:hypothetical protein
MDEPGRRAGGAILQSVDNQLRTDDPPEAREAYQRLLADGYSDGEARKHTACALAAVIVTSSSIAR